MKLLKHIQISFMCIAIGLLLYTSASNDTGFYRDSSGWHFAFCGVAVAGILPDVELTQEQKTIEAVRQLSSQSNQALDNLKNHVQICWNMFWNNTEATPQQISDALGRNAYKIFLASASSQSLIKQLDPSYELLVSPYQFEINRDGTVTIGDAV